MFLWRTNGRVIYSNQQMHIYMSRGIYLQWEVAMLDDNIWGVCDLSLWCWYGTITCANFFVTGWHKQFKAIGMLSFNGDKNFGLKSLSDIKFILRKHLVSFMMAFLLRWYQISPGDSIYIFVVTGKVTIHILNTFHCNNYHLYCMLFFQMNQFIDP